ncbi:GrBNV gp43-like protein-like protein [Mauternbach virus]|uniref:GrBNV gp43-like protein-like protein n=1 Tax=Mauternbach virus TaxID=2486603 RepID=A0A3G3E7J9_9VIRU|nr:GrBNV gp43-like protein-like protein [Mauternbach virus]AYP97915.1 GrBNV gp43-like protein-like protein [Mauternbach virus]
MGTRFINSILTEIATIDSPPIYTGPYIDKLKNIRAPNENDNDGFDIFHGEMGSLLDLRKEISEISGFSRVNKSNDLIEYINQIPTIDTLLLNKNMTGNYSHFGYLNEVEYSANIKCVDLRFPDDDFRILKKLRYYFENMQILYIDGKKISTDYLECEPKDSDRHKAIPTNDDEVGNDGDVEDNADGEETVYIPHKDATCSSIQVNVVTRLDYENDKLSEVTAKLKVVNEKFIYDGCRYSLTGSIEVPLDEFKIDRMPLVFYRKRYFCYWYMSLHVPNYMEPFIFRIAFRNEKSYDCSVQTCNIECENMINGVEFIKCFDLLFKYYKHMYRVQDHLMTPEFLNKNDMDDELFIPELNDEQVEILKTIKYTTDYIGAENVTIPDKKNERIVSSDMAAFVKYVCFNAYLQYCPEHDERLHFLRNDQIRYKSILTLTNFNLNSSEIDDNSNDDDDDAYNDTTDACDGAIYFTVDKSSE